MRVRPPFYHLASGALDFSDSIRAIIERLPEGDEDDHDIWQRSDTMMKNDDLAADDDGDNDDGADDS
jgi:hypothetical protein